MPRSMPRPTAPDTRKASGSAIASDQSSIPGAEVRDDLLHHEGGVGAEHDHFAMRHVDDAHDAEGDGKADRGQQQHGAERDAVARHSDRHPRSQGSPRPCRLPMPRRPSTRHPNRPRNGSAAKWRRGCRGRRLRSLLPAFPRPADRRRGLRRRALPSAAMQWPDPASAARALSIAPSAAGSGLETRFSAAFSRTAGRGRTGSARRWRRG